MPRSTRTDAPEHEHRRRTLSGRTVPAAAERLIWLDLIGPGPKVTGPASLNSDHPSHGYRPTPVFGVRVDPSKPPAWAEELYRAVPKSHGLSRRRRRQLARDLRGAGQHVR